MTDSSPSYGALDHYTGPKGRRYYEVQSRSAAQNAQFNACFFKPYVAAEDTVLDFGCGGGFLLDILAPRVKVGVEINPLARNQAEALGVNVYSSLAEVRGQTFTRIITSHALEHVPCPYQALVEMRDLLDPGGLLLWLSPMDDWRTGHNRRWRSDNHDMHLYTWTPQLMGNLLVAAGYHPRVIRIITHAGPPRLSTYLWNIHPSLFHLAARFTAIFLKRRQLFAVVEHG